MRDWPLEGEFEMVEEWSEETVGGCGGTWLVEELSKEQVGGSGST